MPITPTYPGVYVEEIPSGVRTITGVSTSVALFIGRTKQGPLNRPTLCLNYSDFVRTFSSDRSYSDLPLHVKLFFINGGTQCYVMRIANGATFAKVTLKSEAGTGVLELTAKDAGLAGESIRAAVTYSGLRPEATFNLELFRWDINSAGQSVKADPEIWTGLSMDPASPRYAPTYVTQNSRLVTVAKAGTAPAPGSGISRSGRPVPYTAATATTRRSAWADRLGKKVGVKTNRFNISVGGSNFVEVNLGNIDVEGITAGTFQADLQTAIQGVINPVLPGGKTVTVTLEPGPTPVAGGDATDLLQIASANGDVLIQPAGDSQFDLAVPLMLGAAQGGFESSAYAALRPAPTGIVFKAGSLISLAARHQDAFTSIEIGGTSVPLSTSLQTTGAGDPFYKDAFTGSATGNSGGVREKLQLLKNDINTYAANNPTTFKWTAEVWGDRLALIPTSGGDNSIGTIKTAATDIGGDFSTNVRYYTVGVGGTAGQQTPAGSAASDGNPPKLTDYSNAFPVIDKEVDLFNLMIIAEDTGTSGAPRTDVWGPASSFCQQRRAFLIMDAPAWPDVQTAAAGVNTLRVGLVKDYSAVFYPQLVVNEDGLNLNVGASGAIAGLMARIDSTRGVWKAPAGTEADLRGIVGLAQRFSDPENGFLNPRAINTIRVFPNGIVNWGARTMDGDNDFGSEWKYIPVRRLALYIEESLYRGTKWVVFEPNDEPLWSQIRLNVGAFMHDLFRQGAFQGKSPRDAYLVKCDKETTTQSDINQGIVNILVGFAPLKPAEFVFIKLQQMAGQIET